jgi:hypothetical protein
MTDQQARSLKIVTRRVSEGEKAAAPRSRFGLLWDLMRPSLTLRAAVEIFTNPGIRTGRRGESNLVCSSTASFFAVGTEAEVNEVKFPLPPGFCQLPLTLQGADQ